MDFVAGLANKQIKLLNSQKKGGTLLFCDAKCRLRYKKHHSLTSSQRVASFKKKYIRKALLLSGYHNGHTVHIAQNGVLKCGRYGLIAIDGKYMSFKAIAKGKPTCKTCQKNLKKDLKIIRKDASFTF